MCLLRAVNDADSPKPQYPQCCKAWTLTQALGLIFLWTASFLYKELIRMRSFQAYVTNTVWNNFLDCIYEVKITDRIWMTWLYCVLNIMAVCILTRFNEIFFWNTITTSRPFLRLVQDCIAWLCKMLQDLIDGCKATYSLLLWLEKSEFLCVCVCVCVLFNLHSSLLGWLVLTSSCVPCKYMSWWQNIVIGVIK